MLTPREYQIAYRILSANAGLHVKALAEDFQVSSTITHTIADELGIHARPAGLIAKLAVQYQSKFMIGTGDNMADAAKIIGIMSLCMKQGDEIMVTVEGNDEEAAAAMLELLQENL